MNDTGEFHKGLCTALILGTMGKLAHNYGPPQTPLPTVVGGFDGRVVKEMKYPPTIVLQTDSVQ